MTLAAALTMLNRPLVIAVTGGRHYADDCALNFELNWLRDIYGVSALHVGDAAGADALARRWARSNSVALHVYKADWTRYGKRAGPLRNRAMLNTAAPDVLVAFPGGRGTEDCVAAAVQYGVRVWRVGW